MFNVSLSRDGVLMSGVTRDCLKCMWKVHVDRERLTMVVITGRIVAETFIRRKVDIGSRSHCFTLSVGNTKTVWNEHDFKPSTKIKVYQAIVLTALLYKYETWILYMRHEIELESFHARHLRTILRIK